MDKLIRLQKLLKADKQVINEFVKHTKDNDRQETSNCQTYANKIKYYGSPLRFLNKDVVSTSIQ